MTGVVCRYAVAIIGALAVSTATARAQIASTGSTTTTSTRLGSAHIIEWDLPVPVDFNPGAVVVDTRGEDNNRAWFVTRLANSAAGERKVYRFDFDPSLMKNGGNARWTSWDLTADVVNNGGIAKLRPSHDRRFVVVRTSSSIQEVDTQACPAGTIDQPAVCASALRRWDVPEDAELFVSDVFVSDLAVDDSRRIFTAGRSNLFPTGYVQMLLPTKVAFTSSTSVINAPAGTVTRWRADGVNQCASQGPQVSGFCNSGIDFQPSSNGQNLIYFSDQGFEQVINGIRTVTGAIGELNVENNVIRRWPMPLDTNGQPVTQPRQLKIDSSGRVWVVTGSGHLVSLDPRGSSGCPNGTNPITRHRIPPEALQNDGWGVAPDSNIVGYTDANNNKVGMLLPRDAAVCVAPVTEITDRRDFAATVTPVATRVVSDTTPGIPKTVLKKTTSKQDGTFVEAVINTPAPNADPTMAPPSSMSPLGITPIKSKGQGTFFYAVGLTAGVDGGTATPSMAKRVGFVRLGIPERIQNPRDDEDEDDGLDTTLHPTWHIPESGDDDGDGVPDEYDSPTSRENMTAYAAMPAAALSATDFSATTTASTLAIVATAQADNVTATIAVDVYNGLGVLVGSSGPLPGLATATVPAPGAGTFTVRVRNLSGGAVNITPTVLVREPLM